MSNLPKDRPQHSALAPKTPYHVQPPTAFWRRSISEVAPDEVDPVVGWNLKISPTTKVATAGSCFAQHIARRLKESGYNYFVTEQSPINLNADIERDYNFGTFSARFGNIYTSRQLLQLIQRSYGAFSPVDDRWIEADGSIVDPYRPNIQPGGFPTASEFEVSRQQHFAAVRRMFEELDVFVFTLGLTECWSNAEDGAVYPVCPGAAGGVFDPARHRFLNLSVSEIQTDLVQFANLLRRVNVHSKIILTVSPVPLIATAEPAHVLVATTFSKSVLRVAAQLVAQEIPDTHYFPSYEIITGPHARGAYYAQDVREVLEHGVDHVMRTFFTHATEKGISRPNLRSVAVSTARKVQRRPRTREMRQAINVICDENSLDAADASRH